MMLKVLVVVSLFVPGARAVAARATVDPGSVPQLAREPVLPSERPLHTVIDAARGRVAVNRASGVRIEQLQKTPELRFTLLNMTARRQSIRIGLLHLPEGEYDVYAAGPKGSGTKLDNNHLAAGWQFVLPPPQLITPYGAAVRRLTASAQRTELLLATRAEPELRRALIPLAAALSQNRRELEATRRTDVTVVRAGTAFIQPPVKSTLLSAQEIERRWRELERLQRELIAAADKSGDAAIASRVRRWFNVRLARPIKGTRSAGGRR